MMTECESRVLVAVVAYNEGARLRGTLDRFPHDRAYDVIIVDDGSTDGSAADLSFRNGTGCRVIRHARNLGVGAAICSAVTYARRKDYEIIVIMAGNGKMLPEEIPRLLKPLLNDAADYVQGSRYLPGGRSARLPRFRHIAIRLFTRLANFLLGVRGTDITCGFRAYRLSLLDDPTIDINQTWLRRYELEYYLHYKAVKGGYRIVEVPVSMIYPSDADDYTKIRPLVGWWSMLRPWVYLSLRFKR